MTHSTFEATEELDELLDRVSKGDVVTITRDGKAVAELRPVDDLPMETEARIEEMRRRGMISAPGKKGPFKPLAHRPGGLKRFLDERE